MQVYHKIVKVAEDELDQLGVEPLESQEKDERMEMGSSSEEYGEETQGRLRAQSLTAEQYEDFKALTRQDTVVPDQVFEDRIRYSKADETAKRLLHDQRFILQTRS